MKNDITTFGFNVFSKDLNDIKLVNNKINLLNTISPNSYGISTKDPIFREALKNSDFLVLDGVYFALSSILLQGKNIRKNQGPDVFYHFMNQMNETQGKVFFLGASNETLAKIKANATIDYPNLSLECYSPPFKKEFSYEDNVQMIEAINVFSPDIVFIGMTCPKQEKWAYENKHKLNAKLICCIGAVFDWYAGNEKDIAPIWWKLRLAWLKRTIDRPEILKRYPNIGIFFWHLFLALIGIKKYRNGDI
jgi:N-acetylglucosaminyldiphosphoundecaprenol N-acetyl-beta-D-mannosaminyltransferase